MEYLHLKMLHMTLAAVSLLFFVTRAAWALQGSALLQRRWVRISPHVIDTALLLAGVALMMTLRISPHDTPWLTAKLIGLVVYIGLGAVAIRRRNGWAMLAAVLVFLYIAGAAMRHSPLSWFAG